MSVENREVAQGKRDLRLASALFGPRRSSTAAQIPEPFVDEYVTVYGARVDLAACAESAPSGYYCIQRVPAA